MIVIKTIDNKRGFIKEEFNDNLIAFEAIKVKTADDTKWIFINGQHVRPEDLRENMLTSDANIMISNAINGG